jgi:hypothetical protein
MVLTDSLFWMDERLKLPFTVMNQPGLPMTDLSEQNRNKSLADSTFIMPFLRYEMLPSVAPESLE